MNTVGIAVVALAAANEAGALAAAITLTRRRTRSAASDQPVGLVLAPAIFDYDVLTLDIAIVPCRNARS